MTKYVVILALLQYTVTASALELCDINALDSTHKIESVLRACQVAATVQKRDQLRFSVTENVRICRALAASSSNPEEALLTCVREAVGKANEVLSCITSPKRYREAVAFDLEQSINRFSEYTFVDVPRGVRELFDRVVRSAERVVPARFETPRWNMTAFRHEMANATAGAGGAIFASAGLWSGNNAFSEGELAAVFAHEAAHVVMEHSLKHGCLALEWDDPTNTIAQATRNFREELTPGFPRANAWMKMSQASELEADLVGVRILERAGYGASDMIRLLERLRPADGGGFSSGTHPEIEDRIRRLRLKAD